MNRSNLTWCKKLFGVAAGVLALAGSAAAVNCPGPNTFGHTCTDVALASCPAEAAAAGDISNGDDVCTVVALPWTYKHFGANVNSIGVGSNGQILMGGCGAGGTTFTNNCLPSATFSGNAAILGHWDDMNNTATSTISAGSTGAGPNRIFTVNYATVNYFGSAQTASWQVQMFENGGNGDKVRVRISADARSNTYTMGIQNTGGAAADNLQKTCNAAPASPAVPSCTEFSKPAGGGGGGGGGTCDLTPIEKKLDVQGPAITKLEGKMDAMATTLTTINNGINRLEGKADANAAAVSSLPCQMYRLLNPRLPGKPDAAGSRCLGLSPTTCPNNKACVE